jgi:hypothetical protein
MISAAGQVTFEDNTIISEGNSRNGLILRQMIRSGLPVEKYDALCGTTVRNNQILGDYEISAIGVKQNNVIDGCDLYATPSSLTIEGNTVEDHKYLWDNGQILNEAEWNALGYS